MGFSITSSVLSGIIIIFYSIAIHSNSYYSYYNSYYSIEEAKYSITGIILFIGILEFLMGILAAICCCAMRVCACCYSHAQSRQVSLIKGRLFASSGLYRRVNLIEFVSFQYWLSTLLTLFTKKQMFR